MTLRAAIVAAVAFGVAVVAVACNSGGATKKGASPAEPVGPCRIAFRVRVDDYGDAPSDFYVVNPDSSGLRKLTPTPHLHEWEPEWSPDGRKIAFSATRTFGEATQVFVMNADGTGRRQLTHPAGYNDMGSWSADGRTIFYYKIVGRTDTDYTDAWAMNADGSNKRALKNANETALHSPDGEWIVETRNSGVESDYYGSPDIYVAKANGEDGRWLSRSGDTELFGWSPDSEWILYKRMSGVYDPGQPGLYIVKPDVSERRRLTRSDEYDATWSPDGKSILYARSDGIFVVSRKGGSPRQLTRKNDLSPSWSPGGRRVLFSRNFGIWMINRDGSGLRPVARPRGAPVYESPAWSPSCE